MLSLLLLSLEQSLMYLPLIVGGYIDISLMKVPDLSLESAFTFGAITGYQVLSVCSGLPQAVTLPLVVLAALVGGIVVGLVSSTLTQRLKFPHLLSSIITIGLFHGINQVVLGTSNASFHTFKSPLVTDIFGPMHPELAVLLGIGIVVVLFLFCLLSTQLGYCFAIYGRNNRFFKYHSIDGKRVFASGIMISNGLAGISGYLFAQSNGFVDISMGFGIPLLAITSLIMGKTVFKNRQMNPLIPVSGILIYLLIQQLLLKIGFNLKLFTAVQACIVLIILGIHYRTSGEQKIDHLGV
jgi:putative ABC transport system permease protein